MRKLHLFKAFVATMVMLLSATLPAMAGDGGGSSKSDYYGTLHAKAVGATGAGKVYASKDQTNSPAYDYESTAEESTQNASDAPTWNYYAYAQAQGDGIFKGWYASENCSTANLGTNSPLTVPVSGTTTQGSTTHRYALFVYHYFATAAPHVVGEGGSVSVNGEATATAESRDSQNDSEDLTFSLSAAATDTDHYFVGWYSDEDCTQLVSDQPECTVTVNATATNAAAAEVTNFYAKFEEIVRTDYTFTLVANPEHLSILGGEEGDLAELAYTPSGAANESDVAPYFTFQVDPQGLVLYSVKLYRGSDLVATYATDAYQSSTFAIANTDLDGATVVVESRSGWNLTVVGNDMISSISGNGSPLSFSADGTTLELPACEEFEIAYTPANDEVYVTMRLYNAAGELVAQPYQNDQGAQTFTVDPRDIQNGRLEVKGIVIGDDTPYFYLKADPARIASIKGGLGSSAATAVYDIDFSFSKEGDINLYPEGINTSDKKFYMMFTPVEGANVIYTVTYNYSNDTAPYSPLTNQTTEKTTNIALSEIIKNDAPYRMFGATIDVQASELWAADTDWWITVIGDPSLITCFDGANTNADVPCSLEGAEYHPAGQYTQVKFKAANGDQVNKMYHAYFYPEGADINDPSQAILVSEGINIKNTSSSGNAMTRKMPNGLAHKGTLVIKHLENVGTGSVTINVSGTVGNLVVTNSGNDVTGLKLGANTVQLQGPILNFTHKTDGKHLKFVKRNGSKLREANSEGKYSYSYKYAQDGDVYDIDTDYADVYYNVYIEVPEGCDNFITEVTIEGTATTWTPGQPISVKEGQTLRIVGDSWGYIANGVSVNGVPEANANTSWSGQIMEASTVTFNVTPVERPYSYTLEIMGKTSVIVNSPLGTTLTKACTSSSSKTFTLDFCEADLPLSFSARDNDSGHSSTSENAEIYLAVWSVDGTETHVGTDFSLSPTEGQTVKVEFKKESDVSNKYNVTIIRNEGLGWPAITIAGETSTDEILRVDPDTEIVIASNNYVRVNGVRVNGDPVEANAYGEYVITVTEDVIINISGEPIVAVDYEVGFQAYKWETVYAYVWNDDTKKEVAEWPGVELEGDETGFYTYSFSTTIEPTHIIFNDGLGKNNGGDQTDDLLLEDGKNYTNCPEKIYMFNTGENGNWNIATGHEAEGTLGVYVWNNVELKAAPNNENGYLCFGLQPSEDWDFGTRFGAAGNADQAVDFKAPMEVVEGDKCWYAAPCTLVTVQLNLPTMTVRFEAQSTGIEVLEAADADAAAVYNLQGVKVADSLDAKALVPGVYIVNGTKVMIRK